jgi:ferredoxin-NADP reductase
MTRTYRNETAANVAMADQVQALAQTRADWREVLMVRDAKRDARIAATMRHVARRHAARVDYIMGFCLPMACIVASIITVIGGVL